MGMTSACGKYIIAKERDELRGTLRDTLMHLMGKARRDPAERHIVEQIQDTLANTEKETP